jgi:hypothetical protein
MYIELGEQIKGKKIACPLLTKTEIKNFIFKLN